MIETVWKNRISQEDTWNKKLTGLKNVRNSTISRNPSKQINVTSTLNLWVNIKSSSLDIFLWCTNIAYDKKFNKISKYQYYTASKTDGKKQMFKTEKKIQKSCSLYKQVKRWKISKRGKCESISNKSSTLL